MESALHPPAAAATDELVRRLALLRPGLDQLGLPACVLDPGLRYRYVNPAYEAHAGRPAADFLARGPDEIFAHRPNDERRERLQLALSGERVVFTRQTIEGPEAGKWVRANYFPLQGETGNVLAMVFTWITLWTHSESRLS